MLEENGARIEAHEWGAVLFYFFNKLSICFDLHYILGERDDLEDFLFFLFHLHLEIIIFYV